MSLDGSAHEPSAATNNKKTKRHYADAFAKDNRDFTLFIFWSIGEDLPHDHEDFTKKAAKAPKQQYKKKTNDDVENYPPSDSAASSSSQDPWAGIIFNFPQTDPRSVAENASPAVYLRTQAIQHTALEDAI